MNQKINNPILSGKSGGRGFLVEDEVATSSADLNIKWIIIFSLLSIAASLLFSYALSLFTAKPDMGSFIFSLVGSLVLVLVSIFSFIFIKNKGFELAIALICAFGSGVFLFKYISIWLILGLLAIATAWILVNKKINSYIHNSVKIRSWALVKSSSRIMFSGLALFVAILYAGIYFTNQEVPKSFLSYALKASEPVASKIAPGFNIQNSLPVVLDSIAKEQLSRQENFSSLPDREKATATQRFSTELKKGIEEFTGIKIQENQSVQDYFYQSANNFLNNLNQRGSGFTLVIALFLALIVYAAAKMIFFFLRWVVAVLAILIYHTLHAFSIIESRDENIRKEILIIK